MTRLMQWAIVAAACVVTDGWLTPAHADCRADEGDVDVIAADSVTVICDATLPNPFLGGIGSGGTDTNLTVDVGVDARVESTGVGVNLGDGGVLTNDGIVTATDETVLGTNLAGGAGVTITNNGTLKSNTGVAIDLGLIDSLVINTGIIEAETIGIRMSGSEVDNSGSIDVALVGGVGVDLGINGTLTNSGTITSGGVGIEMGAGSDASNSGTVEAQTTAIVIRGGASLTNSGTVTSILGTAIELTTAGDASNSGTIRAQDTAIVMAQGGSFTNTGTVTSTDELAINGANGVVIVNGGVLSGGGTDAIQLAGGGNQLTLQTGSEIDGRILSMSTGTPTDVLILEGRGSEDDDIETFAALFMRGESWTLSGGVKVLSVDIDSGVLSINGILDTRDAGLVPGRVQIAGGTLSGTGTVIGNVDNPDGTVAAGDPTGTLGITGDYVQGAGGVMRVNSASGQVGVLNVSGTATLAGTVVITSGSDGIYEFLVADGGIVGAFGEVEVDGRAVVSLVPSANSLQFIRGSTTVEDNLVDAALDNAALTLDSLSSGSADPARGGPWAKALGRYGKRNEIDGVPGSDYFVGGGAMGADWAFAGGKSRLGAAVGYTTTDVDIDDGSDAEADNVIYGAYFEYAGDVVSATVAVGGGSSEFTHTRSTFVDGMRQQSEASYDGTTLAARAEIRVRQALTGAARDTWAVEPAFGVDYAKIDFDPYDEQGGAGLHMDGNNIEAVELSGLLRARVISTAKNKLFPRTHIGIVYRIALDDRKWTGTDLDSGISIVFPGDDHNVAWLSIGIGADYHFSRRISGFLDYEGKLSSDTKRHMVIAGLRIDL